MKLINRTSYMDTLTSLIGVPDIKVITGIRRSGKSKLLEALRDYVEAICPIRMSSISTTTSMSSRICSSITRCSPM